MRISCGLAAWLVIGVAGLGCMQSAEDKAIEAAQQGQMVSMGPGGQAGEALDKVAPFPEASAYTDKLRSPEVDPAAASDGALNLRWDFSQESDRVFLFHQHAEFGMRMLTEGMTSKGDTSADVHLASGGDGQAAIRLEDGRLVAQVQRPGAAPVSDTTPIEADLVQKKNEELQPGMPTEIRMALKAEGWSLFDTVDRTVRKAELAVYIGMRTLMPVTPQMRAQLCNKVNRRIPDEIQMQVDADNFVTIALQPAE